MRTLFNILARMLFNRHACAICHVFQVRAPSQNSTKCRADDLCVNFVCAYFCWMLGDPTFFGQITSFSDSFHNTKKKLYKGSFNYFSYTIHIGSHWYMDTVVRDSEVAFSQD